ncbi:MAG: hypothetical protein IRY83_14020 [Chloroflexi bacterium]|nr:hypothetical protein [Chloroflexota bacterium]
MAPQRKNKKKSLSRKQKLQERSKIVRATGKTNAAPKNVLAIVPSSMPTPSSAPGWIAYEVAFQLLAPLHIGWRKVGSLMQTRPYVTARNMWGALTARLARDRAEVEGRKANPQDYRSVGEEVSKSLSFTYFFPALVPDPLEALYPVQAADGPVYGRGRLSFELFDYLLLDTYASTALDAQRYAAEEDSLHEVEMIRPRTRPLDGTSLGGQYGADADALGAPVYLVGYVLVRDGGPRGWYDAWKRLQIGGEGRYGWGRVRLTSCLQTTSTKKLFGLFDLVDLTAERPILLAGAQGPALAHALAVKFDEASPLASVTGTVEPLVGRETRVDEKPGFGAIPSQPRICWTPGAIIPQGACIAIGHYGIWQAYSG